MAPFSVMTASVSLLAKSFTVLCRTTTMARCTSVLPAPYLSMVKCLSSQTSGPPKKPWNSYMRFVVQQRPLLIKQYPETNLVDITRRIAEQWRMLRPEQKRPFVEASVRANAQFKVDYQQYMAQLTPEQIQQQLVEKKQRMDRKRALRQKKELTILGKPKRARTAFNIYTIEHYDKARGVDMKEKSKSLRVSYKNLSDNERQVYTQLAEDEKIRYKNEMKTWESHMVEIGREDLLRMETLIAMRKALKASKRVNVVTQKEVAKPRRKS